MIINIQMFAFNLKSFSLKVKKVFLAYFYMILTRSKSFGKWVDIYQQLNVTAKYQG